MRATQRNEWERQYDEAVRWRDWQTCDQLLEEREVAHWYRGKSRSPFAKRLCNVIVRAFHEP